MTTIVNATNLSFNYIIRLGDAADGCPLVKLGWGHGTRATDVIHDRGGQFILAVSATRDDDIQLKSFFAGLNTSKDFGSETFRLEGPLKEWIDWATSQPWSAKTLDAIPFIHPYPGRWPWTRDSEGPTNGQPSFPGILASTPRKARASLMAQLSSLSDDYYTPPLYIEAARKTMGSIDTDPCSCWLANTYIRAASIFTIETDGLKHNWSGNVWLNPPFDGDKGAGKFVRKLLCELDAGRVTQAVLCLNQSAMSARWFSPLWKRSNRMVLTHHRPVFQMPTRASGVDGIGPLKKDGSPTKAIVFAYIGPHIEKFELYFGPFGWCFREWQQPTMTRLVFAEKYPLGGWEASE